MRIAIFNHPFSDFYTSPARLNPGILYYLADIMAGHEVLCFDVVKKYSKEISLPYELSYIEPYLSDDRTEYSFFHCYKQFGDKKNFNHKEFKRFNPQLVMISSFAYCYADGLKDMADYIRTLTDSPIVIGGGGPSSDPEWYMENIKPDYIICGPAETVLEDFVNGLCNISNAVYKKGSIIVNKDIAYDFKPFYIFNKKKYTLQLQITRGCPKNCSYCSIKLQSDKFIKADLQLLEDVLLSLKDCDVRYVDFEDDNISCDRKYFFDALELVRSYFPDAFISFENGIDFMTLDEVTLERLCSFNVKQFNISFTALDVKMLDMQKRGYTPGEFDSAVRRIISTGKQVIVYYIAGLPGDSVSGVYGSLKYLSGLNVLIGISPFYAVPGTDIYGKLDIDKPVLPFLSTGMSFNGYGIMSECEKVTLFMLTRFVNVLKKVKYSHDELTLKGVRESFKSGLIVGVLSDGAFFEYQLDKRLVCKFFDDFYNEPFAVDVNNILIDRKYIEELCEV